MTDLLVNMVVVAMAVPQLLRIWFESWLFARPREWVYTTLEARPGSKVMRLLTCPLCLGTQLSILLVVLLYFTSQLEIVKFLVAAFAASWVGVLLYEWHQRSERTWNDHKRTDS